MRLDVAEISLKINSANLSKWQMMMKADACHICGKKYSAVDKRVRDHYH